VRIRNFSFSLLILFVGLFAVLDCNKKLEPFRQTQLKMGTYVSISIFDKNISKEKISSGVASAFRAIDNIEQVSSRHLVASELNLLNKNASKNWFSPSKELFKIIQSGVEIATICEGNFDPTITPILELWQFGSDNPRKPTNEEIKKVLTQVDFNKIQIDSDKIRFLNPKVSLDLGGIAKGSAIDAATNDLIENGFQDFMIDAGGDLAVQSSELTKGNIRVWIRHPRKMELLFGYFFLDDGFVATSGDYEQYFIEDEKRYHHIINPKSGYPDSDIVSVTVVAESAELADGFATGILVMGWDKGIEFVKKHPKLQVVILKIGNDRIKSWASESLLEKLQIVDDSL
jgi:FAD:protein FMN transferase